MISVNFHEFMFVAFVALHNICDNFAIFTPHVNLTTNLLHTLAKNQIGNIIFLINYFQKTEKYLKKTPYRHDENRNL